MIRLRHLRILRTAVLVISSLFVIGACGEAPPKNTAAQDLLPNPAGYQVNNVLDIQDAIAKLAGVSALAAAQPQVTALVAAANSLTQCYQKAGAVEGRTYVKIADPFKAGVLFIVNRNLLADPNLLLACVAPRVGLRAEALQPCAKVYTLRKDNNEFYIAYAATDQEVCTTLCSALQGCTSQ